jgi:hypothetical protein
MTGGGHLVPRADRLLLQVWKFVRFFGTAVNRIPLSYRHPLLFLYPTHCPFTPNTEVLLYKCRKFTEEPKAPIPGVMYQGMYRSFLGTRSLRLMGLPSLVRLYTGHFNSVQNDSKFSIATDLGTTKNIIFAIIKIYSDYIRYGRL